MNLSQRRMTDRQLDEALAGLDPAETDLHAVSGDDRAWELLQRVVATSVAPTVAAGEPVAIGGRSPRRPVIGRGVAVAGVAAALAIGSVAAPRFFGAGEALAWSAAPQVLSAEQAAEAEAACAASIRDDTHRPEGADLSGLRPVISEARGSLVLVYATDSRPAPSDVTCYVMDGRVVASGGSLATAASTPAGPVAPNSVAGQLGAVYSTSSWSIRGVTGRVGTDVVALVLDSVAQGPVTATVSEGYFGAWWPDTPTSEAKENAATGAEITGATVTLRDGSTRHMTVEELSGRTAEELGRPDEGGSASAD